MKDRREVLAAGAGIALGAALPTMPTEDCQRPARGPNAAQIPNHAVVTHEGFRALFYDDLVAGRTVILHCMSIATEPLYRTAESLARVQALLGSRLGRDVFFYSLTVDPERDTPKALRELAARHGAGPGWLFLTGETAALGDLKGRLFSHSPGLAHGTGPDCSMALLRYGNAAVGLWGSVPAKADPAWIVQRLSWVQARGPVTGAPRRRGPGALS